MTYDIGQVNRYLAGIDCVSVGPCPGCDECGIPEGSTEYHEDPWFSSSPCELCGGPPGQRESWHGILGDDELVHGSCCEDCTFYLTYGTLPEE